MSIFERLKEDHRRMITLMDRIAATKNHRDRWELARQLRKVMQAHAEAENRTFYKEFAVRLPDLAEELDDALREHEEIDEMLALLVTSSPSEGPWQETFFELRAAVAHHIREEEGEVFALLAPYLDTSAQEKLARVFAATEASIAQAM